MLLLFPACAGTGSTGKSTLPATLSARPAVAVPANLLSPHVLTVGSYTNYPPQEYIDSSTQQPAGFDIDLASALAQRMNLKVHVVSEAFPSLISSLMHNHFDIVISAVSITTEGQKMVQFVPYFRGGESLLVARDNPKNIHDLSHLCGQVVGVREATFEQSDLVAASDACKSNGQAAIIIIALPQQTDVIQLLATKRVVATYQDAPVTDYYLKQSNGSFEMAGSLLDANEEGIVVRKNDPAMLNAVQQAFNLIKNDGTYHTIIAKWGLSTGDLTTGTLPSPTPASSVQVP